MDCWDFILFRVEDVSDDLVSGRFSFGRCIIGVGVDIIDKFVGSWLDETRGRFKIIILRKLILLFYDNRIFNEKCCFDYL